MIEAVRPTIAMAVDHPTRVGEARRHAVALADRMGFDEARRGTVALIVTEAGSNLVKHAGQGELIIQGRTGETDARLEILSIDRGPGMRDVGRCLAGGYSTAGSLGTGLGAIERLSDDFAIHSAPDGGTVLWAVVEGGPGTTDRRPATALGTLSVAAPGEESCGDEWAAMDLEDITLILVVDGLGHGPQAAAAAAAALDVFRQASTDEPREILEAAHQALRSTRGAALAVARLDPRRRMVRYTGIGNIAGAIVDRWGGRTASLISQNGTVGHAVRKSLAFEYPWPEDAAIVMHSDGLSPRWDLGHHPGLVLQYPGLVGGLLYRDHRRGRDDVTVVIASRRDGTP